MGQAAVNYHDFIIPTYNIVSRKTDSEFQKSNFQTLKYYLFISRTPAIVNSIKKNILKFSKGITHSQLHNPFLFS